MEIVGVLVQNWVDGVRVLDDSMTKVWGIGSDRDVRITEAEQYFISLLFDIGMEAPLVSHYMQKGSYYCPLRGRKYTFINCKLQDLTS